MRPLPTGRTSVVKIFRLGNPAWMASGICSMTSGGTAPCSITCSAWSVKPWRQTASFSSIARAIVIPGSQTAKSTRVVVPPQTAARLTCSGGALVMNPPPSAGIGQCVCTCGSMPPGITSLPVASITWPASAGSVPGAATATMRSPSTPTSHVPTP